MERVVDRLVEAEFLTRVPLLSCSRSYVPSADDVGHVIRVECKATKRVGGGVLTKTVDTGIVLPCKCVMCCSAGLFHSFCGMCMC